MVVSTMNLKPAIATSVLNIELGGSIKFNGFRVNTTKLNYCPLPEMESIRDAIKLARMSYSIWVCFVILIPCIWAELHYLQLRSIERNLSLWTLLSPLVLSKVQEPIYFAGKAIVRTYSSTFNHSSSPISGDLSSITGLYQPFFRLSRPDQKPK